MTPRLRLQSTVARTALMVGLSATLPLFAARDARAQSAESTTSATTLAPVEVTAQQELLQAPGVSTITAEQIRRMPPTNDISEIVRRMPGVNLTGNSASGSYGNNRQIDLRGMGPENTLILIDGRPVRSRESVRFGRSGERNTRGDSNWVPADAIERIEVLRGPAAARYGSGAAGGVVNIITRAPTDRLSGSVTVYGQQPEDGDEGNTGRVTASVAGPIAEGWSYRVFGNFNRTDADSPNLNAGAANVAPGTVAPAGREGVTNRDFNGVLRWDPLEGQTFEFGLGYSRQRNIYAGDRLFGTGNAISSELANAGNTTNIMTRRTAFLTHRGNWSFGSSRLNFQYEDTDNERLNEGLAGSSEGTINTTTGWSTSTLRNYNANGEVNVPFNALFPQMLTVGLEYWRQTLDDPFSMTQGNTAGGGIIGVPTGVRDSKSSADLWAFFVEDNINVTQRLTVTPGVRLDHHSEFGFNVSPSLNASLDLGGGFSLKGGIARAFKAPNLYQSNPNYLYYTMGNGCPYAYPSSGGVGCYIMGNADLDPETSWNSEIGILYSQNGWTASVTYFHNKYDNKITAGDVPAGSTVSGNGRVFKWENSGPATVEGIEGNLLVPLSPTLSWNTNFTYMIQNENDETGQPLSVIPEYTINTSLDWQVTERFSLLAGLTYYGKQEPRTVDGRGGQASGNALNSRDPYALVNVSGTFDVNSNVRLTAGITNLFNEQLQREGSDTGSAGANTYNEPGRAYFVSLSTTF